MVDIQMKLITNVKINYTLMQERYRIQHFSSVSITFDRTLTIE